MPPSKVPQDTSVEAKLDIIIQHLQRMDTRDKWRTVGGFFRTLIALIPVLLLLWSAWYFVGHGAEMMKMIADQAASSAADYTKNQGSSMFDEMMKKYQTK
jgi:hypothetical protein